MGARTQTEEATVVELLSYSSGRRPQHGEALHEQHEGTFTSLAKARELLRVELGRGGLRWSAPAKDGFGYFQARQVPLDSRHRIVQVQTFDRTGALHGVIEDCDLEAPWSGRATSQCRFRDGDLVEYGTETYNIGVVLAQPPTPEEAERWTGLTRGDDVYLVGNVSIYHPTDDYQFDHDHPEEARLFPLRRKLPERVRRGLRLRFERYAKGNARSAVMQESSDG